MNPKQRAEHHLFFNKLLAFSHPLCVEIVRSLVEPRPGIYLIQSALPVAIPLYVGRSSTNLQRRLLSHCQNREYYGKDFSFYYVKSSLEAYRLETKAILYFEPLHALNNRIRAAKPRP